MMIKFTLIAMFVGLTSLSFGQNNKEEITKNEKLVTSYLEKTGLINKIDPSLSFAEDYAYKTRYVLVQYCGALVIFELYDQSMNVNIIHKNNCLSEEEQAEIWLNEMNKDDDVLTFNRSKFLLK
ncbi:hypothetical protein NH26_15010 [Flammeovirga pacifica]|uniref:Uncharacterized protein n=2 Tax=Flammeovirga pacifica TaxID=915059 RepID=A0A1S1Z326_FLAPC|nr:hypothetical protein NH26_15010 [Flammeovirga pacifica]